MAQNVDITVESASESVERDNEIDELAALCHENK